MNEWEKAQAGYLYDANYDEQLKAARLRCEDLCYEYNRCRPSDEHKRSELIRKIFKSVKGSITVMPPFYCDYGNICAGENFYANYNVVILDGARVTFGDNVFIAPNCVFSTAGHALDVQQRNAGLEIALPITVGDNVWIGASVTVLPGVTIGSGSIIGAGSVVTKDIPENVIAVGNPCRVLRGITDEDRHKYPVYGE